MNSISFNATTKLENSLGGVYQILYNRNNKNPQNSDVITTQYAYQALALHVVLNLSIISGLYYLLH